MRHFHLRLQSHEPQRVRPSAHVPSGAPSAAVEAPAVDATLDQAAALWTTRRIRSFLVLQPATGTRR
ncbi:hypothetical protein VLK31_23325 [Variovorax sp. H27-G14]|uniref:hypothetical protein n=1 Tax=Variovorax sp. H27-G14 TaxID=3111914 RepID=UPI0038FC4DBE